MAVRRPLVIINGQVQQLPAADSLDAVVSEVDAMSVSNAAASALAIGTPAYVSGANAVQPAQANAAATAEVLGLIRSASIAPSASGMIQSDGVLPATTAQWDAVTNQTGGLTVGGIYYLSAANPGKLTTVPPATIGSFVVRIGRAVSTTELEISLQPPILL